MEWLLYFAVKLAITVTVLKKLWAWLFCGAATEMFWNKIPVREVKPMAQAKAKPKAGKTTISKPTPMTGQSAVAKLKSQANETAVSKAKLSANHRAVGEAKPTKKARRVGVQDSPNGVVGSTKIVILSDPKAKTPPVVATEDLEYTGYIGQDEDISADDVASDYQPNEVNAPPSEELYGDIYDKLYGGPHDDSYGEHSEGEHSGGGVQQLQSTGVTYEQMNSAIVVLTSTVEVPKQLRIEAGQTLHNIQNTAFLDVITGEIATLTAVETLLTEYYTATSELLPNKVTTLENIRIKEFDLSVMV